ncbi:MAG: hypothetical protein ABIZ95_18940 [Pyrinomonadaceae bacterium]
MELRVEARKGVALVVSTVPQPALRKPTVEAALVDIYVGYEGEDIGQARLVGTVAPGGKLVTDFNPDRDRNLRIYKIARSVEGVPDVAQLLDAESVLLEVNRVTEAPAINQATDATHTVASVGVAASRYTRRVRVEISENADMSSPTSDEVYDVDDYRIAIPITRTGANSAALTIYVRVTASGGSGFGAASTIQTITFANIGGSGGSTGSGGYPPGTILPIEHAE